MEKICLQCGNAFNVKKSHYNKRKLCSKICQSEFYKKSLLGKNNPNYQNKEIKKFNCIVCNSVFYKKTYGTQKTCSDACYKKRLSDANKGKIVINKRQKTIITISKMYCKCGNKKDLKAVKCFSCHKELIKKKKNKCVFCDCYFTPNTSKQKFCNKTCLVEFKRVNSLNKNNPNWKGGVGSKNQIERKSYKFKEWRKSVFERDNYTCLDCGKKGGTLHGHHILPFATYVELRFEVSNGKTLCVHCHKKYHPNLNFGIN